MTTFKSLQLLSLEQSDWGAVESDGPSLLDPWHDLGGGRTEPPTELRKVYRNDDPYDWTPGYGFVEMMRDAGALDKARWLQDDRGRWFRRGYEPGTTFDETRWYRHVGSNADGANRNTPAVRTVREIDGGRPTLKQLNQEATRGWSVLESDKASTQPTEYCVECHGLLWQLLRDGTTGEVIRGAHRQPRYCSERCIRDADNRRDRWRRAGGKYPRDQRGWYQSPVCFSLDTTSFAGVRGMTLPPRYANRLNPRTSTRPRAGRCRDVYANPFHEHIVIRRSGRTPHPKVHSWRDSPTPRSRAPRLVARQKDVWKITY